MSDGLIRKEGTDFEVERGGEFQYEVKGLQNRDKKRVQCGANAEIRPGDWLRSKISRNKLYVYDIDIVGKGRSLKSVVAYYATEEEHKKKYKESHEGDIYNINEAYGSVIGSQHDFTFDVSFKFSDLYERIEQYGGGDREELRQMVEEIHDQINREIDIEARGLAKFSELINRHAWITGPLANILLAYWITGSIGQ
jgi:hypothetical protein